MFSLNLAELFVPSTSLLDIVVRGTVVYLGLFVFLRFFRRETGAVGISDVLVVVLIADASQNAMAGGYTSLTEGALLLLVIGAWDYGLDWLGFHVPALRPLLRPKPLPLVVDGVLHKKNLRRELITLDELMAQLRQQGVENVKDVKRCLMEGDGTITVIARDGSDKTKPDRAATP
jgi:uncharacterized membrane protein YcaP (DUF421 family)